MARRRGRRDKRPGRLHIRIERVVLGAIMSVAVLIVERRLEKALGAGEAPARGDAKSVELS